LWLQNCHKENGTNDISNGWYVRQLRISKFHRGYGFDND
jgi:hypothetical protein